MKFASVLGSSLALLLTEGVLDPAFSTGS